MTTLARKISLSDLQNSFNDDMRSRLHSDDQQREAIISDASSTVFTEPVTPESSPNVVTSPTTSHLSEHYKNSLLVPIQPYHSKKRTKLSEWWQQKGLFQLWLWEMVCCVLATSSLIAIIATLRTHDSNTLPQWPYGLSINTIIATYTFVLKASAGLVLTEGLSHLKWTKLSQPQSLHSFVAHDDASRGPLGSMKLLYQNRGWHISSLGALITILIVLLDPFTQQIVRYYDCQKISSRENATISRTNVYVPIFFPCMGHCRRFDLLRDSLHDLRAAMNMGIFATQLPDVDFSCPTGNCSFPKPYTSLGYCSSCEDVTHELNFNEYIYNDGHSDHNLTNVSLKTTSRYYPELILHRKLALSEILVASTTYFGEDTWDMNLYPVVNIIRWNGLETMRSETELVRSYSCGFYPCTKTYKSSVTAGKLAESLESESGYIFSSISGKADLARWAAADLDCLDKPEEQKQILKDLGYEFDDDTRWIPYNVSINVTSETPAFNTPRYSNDGDNLREDNHITEKIARAVPLRCIYNFKSQVDQMISNAFNGSMWISGFTANFLEGSNNALIALWGSGSGNGTLEDVEGFMRKIADYVTTYMRNSGTKDFDWLDELNGPALGQVFYNTTCVRIRWTWMAYPASLVVMLLLFFICTIVQSRNQQARLQSSHDFKSSALTLLFHGLDYRSQRQLEYIGCNNNRMQELQDKTRDVRVKLLQTEQGWKLSSV